ncbi:MAG: hypothetical protein K2M63_03190 [Muribaculaceae bacterium]|nr:hypothetical protein [Muribaculaceae bacterium]
MAKLQKIIGKSAIYSVMPKRFLATALPYHTGRAGTPCVPHRLTSSALLRSAKFVPAVALPPDTRLIPIWIVKTLIKII